MAYFGFRDITMTHEPDQPPLFAYVIHEGGIPACIDCDENNHSVMQYTGLLDKNGREIYEGDVVRWSGYEQETWGGYYDGRTIFTVELGIRTWLKEEKFGYEGELLIEPRDCEVIGNIHDKPEFLSI